MTEETSLRHYIKSGDENTQDALAANEPFVDVFEEFTEFFRWVLAKSAGPSPLPMVLCMNSSTLLLAAYRMALTGHTSATFPILRTALESSAYAYLCAKDDKLSNAWFDREKNTKAKREAREGFAGAVKRATRKLGGDEYDDVRWIVELYEASIDYGAHPNLRSVLPFLTMNDCELQIELSLGTLFSHTSSHSRVCLLACIECALAIANFVVNVAERTDDVAISRLVALGDSKEDVLNWLEAEGYQIDGRAEPEPPPS